MTRGRPLIYKLLQKPIAVDDRTLLKASENKGIRKSIHAFFGFDKTLRCPRFSARRGLSSIPKVDLRISTSTGHGTGK
jgi:hypothetical protein